MASEEAPEGERLVGSGSFRVDSRRAVEILRQRQVSLDFWRPALWVRCAAACGATRMSFIRTATTLTIRFDGAPLSPSLLEQPYGRLAEGAPGAAERWLGWALLHTCDSRMKVSVASGRSPRRSAYAFAVDGSCTAVESAPGEDTVVSVRWPIIVSEAVPPKSPPFWPLSFSSLTPPGSCAFVADAAAFPIEYKDIGVKTLQLPWEQRRERSAVLSRVEGRRIRVAVPARKASLRLSLLGTIVHDSQLSGFPIPLETSVDDPALTVDASLGSAVRDAAFEAAVAAGRTAAESFATRSLELHANSMALAGALLVANRRLRLEWVRALGLARGDEPRLPFAAQILRFHSALRRRSGDQLRILRVAKSVKFLREAARNSLSTPEADRKDPVRAGLWRTPLFFSTKGKPMSLLDFTGPRTRPPSWTGFDPSAGRADDGHWALSPLDTIFLGKRFPERPGVLK